MTTRQITYLKTLLILLFTCLISKPVQAKQEIKQLTDSLDIYIANKPLRTAQKEEKIKNLTDLLHIKEHSLEYEYQINQKLYEEYRKFKLDSAIKYTERNLEIAKTIDNKRLIDIALLRLSTLYSYAGLYLESEKTLSHLQANSLDKDLVENYYEAYSTFYSHYATNTSRHSYYWHSDLYRDSLLLVTDPSSYRHKANQAQKYINQRQADLAENILMELLEQEEEYTQNYASITHQLGGVYRIKQNTKLQKKYYTLSAIADAKNCLMDNASFQSLATIYYEEGNIARALKYSQSAIEDAIFCNIQFRTNQLSGFYTLINASYQEKEAKSKNQLLFYLFLISLLTFFLILSVIYVYQQMKKVSKIKEQLSSTNEKLIALNLDMNNTNELLNEKNEQLSEANEIKEQYIGHFFNLCSTYIDKLENYRKTLHKTAMNKQMEDLFKLLKSNTLIDNEVEELYKNFDTIFLNLYPTFVTEFNALLEKEEQIIPKSKDLLNKELRIYALFRLGISDSVKISTFLRCSLSTVYNYRTKIRNKTVVPRDEFENIVMKIGKIQKKEQS